MNASEAQTAAPAFKSNSEMVLVPVTVTDRWARIVENMRAQDFTVFDNQVAQQIVSFGADDVPCSVGIVLDISGSMSQALSRARDLVRKFLAESNPEDEFLLLTVSTEPSATPRFTTDTTALEQSVSLTRPGGLTSLIDTTYLALKRMKEARQPRRALLLLSDGFDNHSRISQTELINLALEADVQVYSMIFDTGIPGSGFVPFAPAMTLKPWEAARLRQQGPEILEKLSARTGGLYFHVSGDASAKEAVMRTGRALRSEYLIGFHPAESETSGKLHRIRVKSSVPKVSVHARSGYYSR